MKKIVALAIASLSILSAAQAQTVINGVVISHPGQHPNRIQVVPARVQTTRTVVTRSTQVTGSAPTVTRTVIRNVPNVPVHVVTPAAVTTPGTRTVPAFVDSAVPADWVDIRGRVSLGQSRVRLPAGSQVNVRLVDLSRGAARTLITANFTTRHLPASYQVVSSPRRFNAAGRYAVQAEVVSAEGNTLYKSSYYTVNPTAKRVLADITVR